jgi:arsenate reductase (thioredoxin)
MMVLVTYVGVELMWQKTVGVLILGLVMASGGSKTVQAAELLAPLDQYVEQRIVEFDQIDDARKAELEQLARYVRDRVAAGQSTQLTFVCTHNSRRSHLAQIWAKVAAERFAIPGVATFSGGTEVTAFNYRAVAALQRAGMKVTAEDELAENPRYQVRFQSGAEPEICFSKIFDNPANPTADFAAVMTCSHADQECPTVKGCERRIAITYEDPKAADGTPEEADVYDERTRQISREMLYVMSRVAA